MTAYEKLQMVQNELKAPKSQFNKFGNYYYRNCEDILEAFKPIGEKYGAVITVSDILEQIGDRYYIKAIATFIDIETENQIVVTAYAREEENKKGMDSSQVTGATSSYARKYALNGLLCIDDTKDADSMDNSQKQKTKKDESPDANSQPEENFEKVKDEQIDTAKIITIKKELMRTGVSEMAICKRYGIDIISELTNEKFMLAMSGLKKTKDKA